MNHIFDRFFCLSPFVNYLLCAPFKILLMNATQVEIQRIQTRLQQLGRAKQSVASGSAYSPSGGTSGDRHSTAYLELPDTSPAVKPEFGYGDRPHSRVSVAERNSQPNTRLGASPQSNLLTQARSVEPNDETFKALHYSPHAPTSVFNQYQANSWPAHPLHQRFDEHCQTLDPTEHSGQESQQRKTGREQYGLDTQASYSTIVSDPEWGQAGSTTPTSNPYFQTRRVPTGQAPPKNQTPSPAQTQLQHHTQLQSPLPQKSPQGQNKTRLQNQTYLQNQPSVPHTLDPLADAFDHLSAKAQHVNAISHALRDALRDVGAIAQTVDRQIALASVAGAEIPHMQFNSALVCNSDLALPHLEQQKNGAFVVKTLPMGDVSHAHQAENLAQHLQGRSADLPQSASAPQSLFPKLFHWLFAPKPAEPDTLLQGTPPSSIPNRTLTTEPVDGVARTRRTRLPRTKSSSPSFGASLIWVGGSILMRMGLDALLVAYPALWPPAIALVVTPAAIAIYRTAVYPQSSFLLGRRLLLIMIGLLLGGRL